MSHIEQRSGSHPTPPLYDRIPEGATITAQVLRQQYDGTVFEGENALQVEFDEQGEITLIRSFDVFTNQESIPFVRGSSGGWRGEGGFYGESTVLGRRMDEIVAATKEEWKLWHDTSAQHPGIDFRTWKIDRVRAMAAESKRLQDQEQT